MTVVGTRDHVSPRVQELIRLGASRLLESPDDLQAEIDAAALAGEGGKVAADPSLASAVGRANRANLVHWARANIAAPGELVAPNVGRETLAMARDFVRRGLDEEMPRSYRIGQNVAWRRCMDMAFRSTTDATVLREILEITSGSIFSFVDATLAGVTEQIERERGQLTRSVHAERLKTVSLILDGVAIDADRVSARLRYALDRRHTAAILWADGAEGSPDAADRMAEELGRLAGARPLVVTASASSRWVWLPGDAPADEALHDALRAIPGVRAAVGPGAAGVDGFRSSHEDARAAQRILARAPARRLARYDDVRAVALATEDEERAYDLVDRALGELSRARPELRETLRVYLREQCNAARTARVLHVHRNTVLSRLERALPLLPEPLPGRVLDVALALEIHRWDGDAG